MLDPTENGLDAAGSSQAGSLLRFDATRFVLVPICFCVCCEIALLFLDYFINYVNACSGRTIPAGDAVAFAASAQEIIAVLQQATEML